MKDAVSQAQAQFEKGDLGADKVRAVEREYEKVSSQIKDLDKQAGSMSGFSKIADKMGINSANIKTAVGTVGIAVGAFLKDSVSEAGEAEQADKNLEQTLISTKDASGMTAKSLDDLASSLQKSSTFSDDQIKSGEGMLLTFTNIGKNVFPQATQALLDMSQKMGTDTSTQAVQLGKALNDPINGISALSRVGVTFTDKQKDMIKQMVNTGDTAGAQKVILDELNKEFGGQAATAADTYAGKQKQLGNQIKEIEEKIGEALLPILQKVAEFIEKIVVPIADFISKNPKLTAGILAVVAVLGTLIGGLSVLGTVMTAINLTMDAGLLPTLGIVIAVIAAVAAIAAVVIANWKPISTFFINLWKTVTDAIVNAWNGIKAFFTNLFAWIGAFFTQWGPLILAVIAPFIGIPLLIIQHWGQISTFFSNLWDGVRNITVSVWNSILSFFNGIPGFFSGIGASIRGAFDAVIGFISGLPGRFSGLVSNIGTAVIHGLDSTIDFIRGLPGELMSIGTNIVQGLWNGITGAWHTITDGVKNLTSGFVSGFKNALGIHSPSTIFAGIGGFISQGLANGISSTAGAVTNSLQSLVQNSISTATKSITESSGLQTALDTVAGSLKTTIPLNFSSAPQVSAAMAATYGNTQTALKSGAGNFAGADQSGSQSPVFQQTVNNYSPKALSPAEAARQTRNATRQLVLAIQKG